MKYSERDSLVANLRELADFIEERGIELPHPYKIRYHAFCSEYFKYDEPDEEKRGKLDEDSTKANLRKYAKAMGRCDKDYGEYSFKLRRKFGDSVELILEANRDAVCEKKIVAYKEVDETKLVVIGKKREPVYETICKPLSE